MHLELSICSTVYIHCYGEVHFIIALKKSYRSEEMQGPRWETWQQYGESPCTAGKENPQWRIEGFCVTCFKTRPFIRLSVW
jgi:hypothetical protein